MAMCWKVLSGDVDMMTYGGKLVSPRLNHGEFDFWLVLEVCPLPEDFQNDKQEWCVDISVVAPSEVSAKDRKQALQFVGATEENLVEWGLLAIVEMLHGYGIRAVLHSACGEKLADLIREAKEQAEIRGDLFFGFAMDAPQNAIGATGWDLIRGNLLGPLSQRSNQPL